MTTAAPREAGARRSLQIHARATRGKPKQSQCPVGRNRRRPVALRVAFLPCRRAHRAVSAGISHTWVRCSAFNPCPVLVWCEYGKNPPGPPLGPALPVALGGPARKKLPSCASGAHRRSWVRRKAASVRGRFVTLEDPPRAQSRPRTHSRELGEYVDYRERWDRSLFVIVVWLAIGTVAAIVGQIPSVLAGTVCHNYRGYHYCVPADQDWWAYTWIAVAAFGLAAIFIARQFRRPGVRVGELGLDCRTGMVHFWHVSWDEVGYVDPSHRGRFRQTMKVALLPKAIPHDWDSISHVVRLSGLSDPPWLVEKQIDDRLAASRRSRTTRIGRIHGGRGLDGCEVNTERSESFANPTTDQLRTLLDEMTPGESFLTLRRPETGSEGSFIQTTIGSNGLWWVEYRERGSDVQFGAECPPDVDLFKLFIDWADGSAAWRTELDWQPIAL